MHVVSAASTLSLTLSLSGAGLPVMQVCGLGSPDGPLSALVAQLAREQSV